MGAGLPSCEAECWLHPASVCVLRVCTLVPFVFGVLTVNCFIFIIILASAQCHNIVFLFLFFQEQPTMGSG